MLYSTVLQRQSPDHLRAVMPANPKTDLHFEICSLESAMQESFSSRTSFYEIIWFKSAAGQLWIDSRPYTPGINTIYFLSPGQLRRFSMQGETSGYRIQFSAELLYRRDSVPGFIPLLNPYNDQTFSPVIVADSEMQQEMDDIVQKMEKEFYNYYLLRSEILAGLLSILLVHFSRRLPANETPRTFNRDNMLLKKFLQLLQEKFTSKRQVADYASELCVTPNYLNRSIKKITGHTASYHIQQQIILEAKRRAIHSGESMKEIAYWLGFDNLAHFSKFFKNNSGMSFSRFRKQAVCM